MTRFQDDSIELRPPAKINLSFKIRDRRADGFHEIESLMTPISLYDRLTIRRIKGSEIDFHCSDPTLPRGSDNLVARAARLFFDATKLQAGVRIELEKSIPHGAGLGGGSSNAAATLLGLNELFGKPLAETRLAELGGQIGSDVPFFIFRSAAICRGRGELVEPRALPNELRLVLLKPDFGVPTPWAYSRWMNSRELPGINYGAQEFADITFVNDLERPVFEKHLFLAQTKMWLLKQPETGAALMSGSGSTVFAVLRAEVDGDALAARAKAELDPELWTCACEAEGRASARPKPEKRPTG